MNGTIIEIFDDNTTTSIQLVTALGDTCNIQVSNIKLYLDEVDQLVYIYDPSNSNMSTGGSGSYEPCFYTLDFTQITTPLAVDAGDLYSIILGYMQAAAGAGDASAANQVLQIDQANTSGGNSVFKKATGDSVFMNALRTDSLYDLLLSSKTNDFDFLPSIYSLMVAIRADTTNMTQETFSAASIGALDTAVNGFIAANPTVKIIHMSSFAIGVTFYTTIQYK